MTSTKTSGGAEVGSSEDLRQRLPEVGGLSRFNFNPSSGQIVHGPTAACFVCTDAGLTILNPDAVPPDYLALIEFGAKEAVRLSAEHDPRIRFDWLDATGRSSPAT
jgi:hypothetical protein